MLKDKGGLISRKNYGDLVLVEMNFEDGFTS
jgi:hypothetical protein